MYVRIAMVLARVLMRLALRMAPFLAIAGAGLFRKYRWRVHDRFMAYSPRPFSLSRLPLLLLAVVLFLAGIGLGLYLIAGRLAPG